MSIAAVIVAAGEGRRMGGPVPKQFQLLGGVPLVVHSLRAFAAHQEITMLVLVTDPAQASSLPLPPGVRVVAGGATRQASVRAGLEALAGQVPERVLIHDAARPFVTVAQISAVLDATTGTNGAILAVPVADTLKQATPDPGPFHVIGATLPRDGLWAAQTPQAFPYPLIRAAHQQLAGQEHTDDAALFEALGHPVQLVPGDRRTFKLTTPEDFIMAEALLAAAAPPQPAPEIRTGQGFDVHAFTDGNHVMLGGVRVPHSRALAGHSDADVALHALTDALLGALGEGDIGQHFPPSDPQWRGRDSRHFLRHAVGLLTARGGAVANADLTIICEQPKVGPHRDAMRAVIAADLGITPERVNIKGTTTERLGFTGRGEGIAAQAVITIRIPA